MQAQDRILERLDAAHVELCVGLAIRLARRVPPGRVVDLYAGAMSMAPGDARRLRQRVLQARREAPTARHGELLRFRDWMRFHAAPWKDPDLADELEAEFIRCRRLLGIVAARGALASTAQEAVTRVQLLPLDAELKAEARTEVLRRTVRRVTLPGVAGLRLPALRAPAKL